MRWIYISPHFDDGVLSCGGLIWEQAGQGLPVEIWTICGGEPDGPLSDFALAIHAIWQSGDGPETIAMRKQEDEAAAACVGADIVHFDFQDCIYRRARKGEYLYPESVFVAAHPQDARLPKRMASVLQSELLPGDIVVAPLALGGHIDHVLVRQAVELLGRPLRYYADIPYLLNYPDTLAPAVQELDDEHFSISPSGIENWLAGIASYKSQISSLYRGEGTLDDAVRRYGEQQGGIRLWRARSGQTS
jgi:LmbE family N-acetylglucosaminyl deacetylase